MEYSRVMLWELRLSDGSTIILCSHHRYRAYDMGIMLDRTDIDIPDAGIDPAFQCSVCRNEVS